MWRLRFRRCSMTVVPALLVLAFGAVPALAHHKDGHGGGSGRDQGGSHSTVTEDNDDNDGGTPNNQVDAGDNRHPSGKDRSVENGNSGNQGRSGSDPDGDSNGGPDKPGGSGGVDLADQDGNNGCGTDDDFEDDNNGNCGGRKDEARATRLVCTGDMSNGQIKRCVSTDADGGSIASDNDSSFIASPLSSPHGRSPLSGALNAGAEVLGDVITRGGRGTLTSVAPVAGDDSIVAASTSSPVGRPATMAFTGASVVIFLAAGLAIMAAGYFISRLRRE
jgi:hypothetical protein